MSWHENVIARRENEHSIQQQVYRSVRFVLGTPRRLLRDTKKHTSVPVSLGKHTSHNQMAPASRSPCYIWSASTCYVGSARTSWILKGCPLADGPRIYDMLSVLLCKAWLWATAHIKPFSEYYKHSVLPCRCFVHYVPVIALLSTPVITVGRCCVIVIAQLILSEDNIQEKCTTVRSNTTCYIRERHIPKGNH